MTNITFVCVCNGTKYSPEYVKRLKNSIERNLDLPHKFICITDKPEDYNSDIETLYFYPPSYLPKWWSKMLIFNETLLNSKNDQIIFFDLDMVIINDLRPLVDAALDIRGLGICRNFTRERQIMEKGHATWDCRYGSCVMTLNNRGSVSNKYTWHRFCNNKDQLMKEYERFGDQKVIEVLRPNATILQDVLPEGFFVHYKDFTEKPEDCLTEDSTVMVFAGNSKPDNCEFNWIRKHWK